MLSFRYLGTSICFSLIGVTLSCLHPTRKMKIIAPVQEDALLPYAYPETPKGTESDLYFGQRVDDPYRWLEDGSSPEVKNWVAAQEAFTAHYFANPGLETLRTKIKKRLEEVLDYTKIGLPQKHGAYIYYWKHEGLKPQDVYYRKNIENASALEEIVLDPNTFSANGTVAASPVGFDKNHRYMVYSVSSAGSDWQHFAVRDLHSLRDLDDKVAWIKFSAAAFAGDGFYYQRFPEPQPGDELSGLNQNAAVYYHRLGEPQSADRKIFANPLVPQNTFGVSSSDDESYLIITENKGTYGNGIHYLDLKNPSAQVQPLITEVSNENSVVTVLDGKFIVLTDHQAPNFRMVAISPQQPEPQHWQDIIVHESQHKLEAVSYLGEHFIARYLVDVSSKVKRFDRKGRFLDEVPLPGLGTVSGFGGEEKETATYFSFSSYTVPESIYRYEVNNNTSSLYASSKSAIKVNTDDFTSEQVFYPSKDGTRIPMVIIHRKGMVQDGSNPTMLYGYGGFNVSLEPAFSSLRFGFLEQGGVIAIANLRGGGEYGEEWHKAGMKQAKQNVFDDCIAAAEYLIAQRITSSAHLALNGGSNGGLLVGAVMTQRPDLIKVAVPEVGVLDMLRFHKFTIGHAWTGEYGSSEESAEMFGYLLGYSPVHQVKNTVKYPATLIMTSDHDDRVVPAHSFKFAAALQAVQRQGNPILLGVTTQAGHGAGSSLQQQIAKAADKYAFILYHTR